jgi:MYXO-CTERM domain-containing protein
VDEESFWSNPSAYSPVYDPETWDGPAFAAALEERIIGPGEHAFDLLNQQSYLTRMFTTISPEEMTEDPLFHENPDLPDVSNQHSATRWLACEGPDWVELEDGRLIAVDDNGALPRLDEMPYAETIETIPASGAPMNDRDNTETIEEALEDYNDDFRDVDRGGCGCSTTLPTEGILFTFFVLGAATTGRRRRRI